MNFQQYQNHFQEILSNQSPPAPYDNSDYIDYAKLNWSRQQRWLKTAVIDPVLAQTIADIKAPQEWIIITEPWCGDASHIVPFIHKIAGLNSLITTRYQLRDTEPFLINQYLTNGGKAIPKLIVRDEVGKDLLNWGARPVECQIIYTELTAAKADFETIKIELQKWYNLDKGRSLQQELNEGLS